MVPVNQCGSSATCQGHLPTPHTPTHPPTTPTHTTHTKLCPPRTPPLQMTVAMAGRCAERLVLGEANLSTSGAKDLEQVRG